MRPRQSYTYARIGELQEEIRALEIRMESADTRYAIRRLRNQLHTKHMFLNEAYQEMIREVSRARDILNRVLADWSLLEEYFKEFCAKSICCFIV